MDFGRMATQSPLTTRTGLPWHRGRDATGAIQAAAPTPVGTPNSIEPYYCATEGIYRPRP